MTLGEKITITIGLIIMLIGIVMIGSKHDTHYGVVTTSVVCDGEYCVDIKYDGLGGLSGYSNSQGFEVGDLVTVDAGFFGSKVRYR